MPYAIRHEHNEYLVVNRDTGHVFGRHPSQAEARRQLAALWANADDTEKALGVDVHDASGKIVERWEAKDIMATDINESATETGTKSVTPTTATAVTTTTADDPIFTTDARHKAYDARIDTANEAEREIIVTITTQDVDRDEEVVVAKGIDLTNYRTNKVVMWAHNYTVAPYNLPVAKCVWIKPTKDGHGLVSNLRFATHAFADDVYKCYRDGYLSTVSVGLRGQAGGPATKEEAAMWPGVKSVVRQSELIEISCVPIPANPHALVNIKSLKTTQMRAIIQGTKAMNDSDVADDGGTAAVGGENTETSTDADAATTAITTKAMSESSGTAGGYAVGDAVQIAHHKGGGIGCIKSLHTEGVHPHDSHGSSGYYDGDSAEPVEASKDKPVAKVAIHKAMNGGWAPTDRMKSVHTEHLTKMGGDLCPPMKGYKAVKPTQGADDPDDDDDDADKPAHMKIKAGHYVEYGKGMSGGCGKVMSIHKSGKVPGVEGDVTGSEDDPAAKVKVYKEHPEFAGKFRPTDKCMGKMCKELSKVPHPLDDEDDDAETVEEPVEKPRGKDSGKGKAIEAPAAIAPVVFTLPPHRTLEQVQQVFLNKVNTVDVNGIAAQAAADRMHLLLGGV